MPKKNLVKYLKNLVPVLFVEYRKCLSKLEATAVKFFQSAKKNPANLVEDINYLIRVKFPQISLTGVWGKVENMKSEQRTNDRRMTGISWSQ